MPAGSSFGYADVEAIFQEAVDLADDERRRLLDRRCAGNRELRSEVEVLLKHYAEASDQFLTRVHAGVVKLVESALPRRIGEFEIIGLVGQGGMGVVYEARQHQPRRTVAVKAVRSGLASDEALRRFEYEAAVLARLQHPGIAHVYQAGVGEQESRDGAIQRTPFFAMEFVRGEPLNRYAEQRRCSLRERVALMIRVCDAVEHAHQKGVVHRDLKPQNILVDENGAPKVLDFGVARALQQDAQQPTMHTEATQLIGTVPYMSPEQVSGRVDDVDTRSDVYALGVVLFELIAGRLPYDIPSNNLAAAARVISEQPPLRLGAVQRAARGDLETIIEKALAKDVARRYSGVQALRDDLQRYLDGEPIAARRDSLWYVARKLLARYRLPIGAIAVLALAVLVTSVAATVLAIERGSLLAGRQMRFEQVRKLTSGLLFDMHARIEKLPGAAPARKYLIDSALEYLESLAHDAGEDPTLQLELADSYSRLAALQGNPNYVNLGDTDGALRSYRESLAWAERYAKSDPGSLRGQRLPGLAHSGMGDVLLLQGDRTAGLTAYEAALDTAERLHAAHPEDSELELDLASAHIKIASIQEAMGKHESARTHRELAIELNEATVARDPSTKARVQLAVAYVQLGDSQRTAGDPAAALASYERSLTMRRTLLEAAPDNVDYQRGLALALQRVGNAKMLPAIASTLPPGAALDNYRESLERFAALARADDTDARAARDLTTAHEKVGTVHLKAFEWALAIEQFRASLAIRQRLVLRDPQNVDFASDLAVGHLHLGRALAGDGDHPGAEREYRAAVDITAQLYERDPQHAGRTRAAAVMRYDMGLLYAAIAELPDTPASQRPEIWSNARAEMAIALRLLTELDESGRLAPSDKPILDMMAREIARCDEMLVAASQPTSAPAPADPQ